MNPTRICVLSGAGISAASGIKTFRDAGGLWEGHRVEDVATPEAWQRNPDLVLDFYNQRRRQLLAAEPNAAHYAITRLQEHLEVVVVTQNVDDLHERAGNARVIHLHGELRKARSTGHEHLVYTWDKDLLQGDLCEKGYQLRPHIVWFGEAVPLIEKAALEVAESDILIIVGTSMQVYPAAGLVHYAGRRTPIYYIDPKPALSSELRSNPYFKVIAEPAAQGLPQLAEVLINEKGSPQ